MSDLDQEINPNDFGEYDESFDCANQYDYSGNCPCCDGWVKTIGGNYEGDCQYNECDQCGWRDADDC